MYKKIISSSLVIGALLAMNGCANKVHDYSVSTENMISLKSVAQSTKSINIGNFTDSNKDERSVMCRLATPIGTPQDETFASYIQNALKKELLVSNMYNPSSSTIITANLNDIYGSTTLGNAYWSFDITMKSTNGTSYTVKSKYDYESSFSAYSACSEMQRSYTLAVQKLIGEIINNPKFITLAK